MPYQLKQLKDGKPTCSNKCSAAKRKVKYNCECYICKKPLYRSPSQLKKLEDGKPVCSRKCMGKKKTKKHTEPKYSCFICGKKFHRAKNQIDRLKDKRLTCSRKCANEKKAVLEKESIENKLNVNDFKVWLENKYHVEKLNSRDIAEIVYGKRAHGPNITGWMERLGVDARSRSDAVALQWKDNPARKKAQADFMKTKLGKGTPGRQKIIEIMQSEEYKLKQSIAKTGERNGMFGITGEKHPKWNAELTDEERAKKRNTPEYEKWRIEVYKNDDYICQCCKDKRGGNLVAHHLNGYNWDIGNRYNPDNGVTLCEDCHIEFHRIYGYGNNTRKQFEYFKNNTNPQEYKEQLALF